MEKCKKLSLKKRKNSSTNLLNIKKDVINNTTHLDDLTTTESVSLDEKHADEQRQTSNGKRTIADIDDPNLQKLKELIMRVSANEKANGNELLPFPPMDTHCLQTYRNTHQLIQERQLTSTPFTASKDELLPFPDFPSKYKRRKKQTTDEEQTNSRTYNQAATSVSFQGSNANGTIVCVPVKELESTDCLEDKKGINPANRVQPSEPETNRHSSRRSNPVLPTQNCHLIRDWNSNYYSLQSQNQKLDETSVRPTSDIQSSRTSAIDINPSAQCDVVKNIKDKSKQSDTLGANVKASTSTVNDFKSCESNNEKVLRQNLINKDETRVSVAKPCLSKDSEDVSLVSRKESSVLEKCPLCQKEFEKTITQMDVDSHIAQCLSNSEDDAMW